MVSAGSKLEPLSSDTSKVQLVSHDGENTFANLIKTAGFKQADDSRDTRTSDEMIKDIEDDLKRGNDDEVNSIDKQIENIEDDLDGNGMEGVGGSGNNAYNKVDVDDDRIHQ